MSVLREAALAGLRRARRRRRLVVLADRRCLARARASNKLAIDARLVAEALLSAEPTLFKDDAAL